MGFFRLIRINNLFIIVLTLIGVWYGSAHSLILNSNFISYLLMILFTILIAGAGNAINDYVDADGNIGNFQNNFKVYGRMNQNCIKCSNKIEKVIQNGRSSFFCQKCQK